MVTSKLWIAAACAVTFAGCGRPEGQPSNTAAAEKSVNTATVAASPTGAAPSLLSQAWKRYSTVYDKCMFEEDAAAGEPDAMMACLRPEIDRQTAQLDQTYKLVGSRLSPPQRLQLQKSEHGWMVKRDKTCRDTSKDMAGRAVIPVDYRQCILAEIVKRTIWLETYRP